MAWKPRAPPMSKEAMRQESKRLVGEALGRNMAVTQGKTRRDVKCGKCGAPNRVTLEMGKNRVEYDCKECGHKQRTL
jgi:DNA-directed RNA polymerase subunit RPC12/RpoP